jgi:protocatechuate 3,4-dioxygenase beta subunit
MLAGWSAPAARSGNVPSCIAKPQQTEGPYFIDESLNRSDIRSDPSDGSVRPGTALDLRFRVSRLISGGCSPLAGAVVDVWHCDHQGAYSDVEDPNFNTVGKKFLRGYQVTDAEGVARFKSIYPGWYPGRTVHIHFKIRSAPSAKPGFDFTSQLYFDDALTDRVHAQPPYSAKGQRRRRNADDHIFSRGGSDLIPPIVPTANGYSARFAVALQSA